MNMNDIQQVLNPNMRDDFMSRFHRFQAVKNDEGMQELSDEVQQTLKNQAQYMSLIQGELDSIVDKGERVKAIMNVSDNQLRIKLIQNNSDLFSKGAVEPLVYDTNTGLYMTQEQLNDYQKREQRTKIMAIRDSKERLNMISNNLHLFR